MAWDDDKQKHDELSSDEWDNHVDDQKNHSHRHEKGGADELTKFGTTTHDEIGVTRLDAARLLSAIDADRYTLQNVGHNELDLPQSVQRTVADFEGGTLPQAFEGDTGSFSVQSSVVESGDFALECSGNKRYVGTRSLPALPQQGDVFSHAVYLTDTDDAAQTYFATQSVPEIPDGYRLVVDASNDQIDLDVNDGGFTDVANTSAPISNHLNEWLNVTVEWGRDGSFTVTVTDSTGAELGQTTGTDNTYTSGGIGLRTFNSVASTITQYWDSFTFIRPESFARADTKRGTTELGNEVTPSGSIKTGPATTPTNAERGTYARAPVDDSVTQGTQSLLTLLQSGLDPAMYVERTLDGQGGAYGHQLQAPLGRFSRLNANLSWEYDTFADVPNWVTQQGGTAHSFGLTGQPRRLQVAYTDVDSDTWGGATATAVTTVQALSAFRVTYSDVSFTDNGGNGAIGIGNGADGSTDPTTTTAVYVDPTSDELVVVNAGTVTRTTLSSAISWGSNHDISIEYDGAEARALVDGDERASVSFSATAQYRPLLQLNELSGQNVSDTLEAQQPTVEPLGGVLN